MTPAEQWVLDERRREGKKIQVAAEALARLTRGHLRYEFLRTLNPRQFKGLWERCLKEDVRFDDEVDRMRKERADDRG